MGRPMTADLTIIPSLPGPFRPSPRPGDAFHWRGPERRATLPAGFAVGFKVVSLALAFLILPVLSAAEEKTPPVFGAELELVKVTVTVRDAAGQLVTNLRAGDFVVSEDGRAQTLDFFTRTAEDEGDVAPIGGEGAGAESGFLAELA